MLKGQYGTWIRDKTSTYYDFFCDGARANGVLMEYAEKPSKTSNDRKMSFGATHNNTKE